MLRGGDLILRTGERLIGVPLPGKDLEGWLRSGGGEREAKFRGGGGDLEIKLRFGGGDLAGKFRIGGDLETMFRPV